MARRPGVCESGELPLTHIRDMAAQMAEASSIYRVKVQYRTTARRDSDRDPFRFGGRGTAEEEYWGLAIRPDLLLVPEPLEEEKVRRVLSIRLDDVEAEGVGPRTPARSRATRPSSCAWRASRWTRCRPRRRPLPRPAARCSCTATAQRGGARRDQVDYDRVVGLVPRLRGPVVPRHRACRGHGRSCCATWTAACSASRTRPRSRRQGAPTQHGQPVRSQQHDVPRGRGALRRGRVARDARREARHARHAAGGDGRPSAAVVGRRDRRPRRGSREAARRVRSHARRPSRPRRDRRLRGSPAARAGLVPGDVLLSARRTSAPADRPWTCATPAAKAASSSRACWAAADPRRGGAGPPRWSPCSRTGAAARPTSSSGSTRAPRRARGVHGGAGAPGLPERPASLRRGRGARGPRPDLRGAAGAAHGPRGRGRGRGPHRARLAGRPGPVAGTGTPPRGRRSTHRGGERLRVTAHDRPGGRARADSPRGPEARKDLRLVDLRIAPRDEDEQTRARTRRPKRQRRTQVGGTANGPASLLRPCVGGRLPRRSSSVWSGRACSSSAPARTGRW